MRSVRRYMDKNCPSICFSNKCPGKRALHLGRNLNLLQPDSRHCFVCNMNIIKLVFPMWVASDELLMELDVRLIKK